MAPTNLAELIGSYNRTTPITINPILPRSDANSPLHLNPLFLVPFTIIIAIVVLLIVLFTWAFIQRRVEKKRQNRIHAEMWAAARRAGIEHGVSSVDDAMIMYNGIVYHFNFESKEFEAVAQPGTPHFDAPRESGGEVVARAVGGEMQKVWKGFKQLFSRRV